MYSNVKLGVYINLHVVLVLSSVSLDLEPIMVRTHYPTTQAKATSVLPHFVLPWLPIYQL